MNLFREKRALRGGGFTVLELMVACVVIAVMAGFAIPRVSMLTRSFELLNAKSYLL
ncbi:MAG: prepilin-type N-terminal cleavage/methylation domain-containing protein [Deltaproteobacteria bacterium]|nr:prepilin-type N-terminal cleavage/methylation domain-containing protein [Deltaproteobacteria bacterium]